ncbi:MAG TPA: energy transducer TonB [Flavobacteriales bacterium]|nr:energy transducer TonB [Flavobacteriales bacterium]
MRKILAIVVFGLLSSQGVCQEDVEKEKVFDVAQIQEPAEYPGGMAAMIQFLSTNLVYPQTCVKDNIQGKVYIEFVVDKDGSVTNIRVKRPIHAELDAEAVRVVSLFPKWKPALNDGKPVKCKYVLPVNFKLGPVTQPTQEKK